MHVKLSVLTRKERKMTETQEPHDITSGGGSRPRSAQRRRSLLAAPILLAAACGAIVIPGFLPPVP